MNIAPAIEARPPDAMPDRIDFSRRFMPEELTPLHFAPAYQTLTEGQRLRYNQLSALYFNEQTMFFEKTLAHNVLGYFLAQKLPEELKAGLAQFLTEEEQHTAMFRRLNRQCDPGRYAGQDFHFIQVPRFAAGVLNLISRRPDWFSFLIWIMHLQEERALFFGKAFVKSADVLEPHFVTVQRRHLADEIGHVRWDEALLVEVWARTRPWRRRVNVRLLTWLVGEYFTTPKRSARRVLAAFVAEFPALQPRYPEFCRQLAALEHDARYRRSLYCAENAAATFKLFDRHPEFRSLMKIMPGYIPGNLS